MSFGSSRGNAIVNAAGTAMNAVTNRREDSEDLFAHTRMSLGDHIEELRRHMILAIGFFIGMILGFFGTVYPRQGNRRRTAHMFLIFALRRPNILPSGDLGIRTAIRKAYGLAELPKPAEIEQARSELASLLHGCRLVPVAQHRPPANL